VTFVPALSSDEIWSGEMRAIAIEDKQVLLLRIDHELYAYEDRCAHLGFPLSSGTLESGVLTCSVHHYCYDARSGCGINPKNVRLKSFAVREDAGRNWVDVQPGESASP
jgi:toluene monooxygenase system ferredoxin subunit